VIDDSYNANPTAMKQALDVLAASPAPRRIAVLGEMLELGPIGVDEHARVGDLVADAGVAALVTVGGGTDELAAAAKARGVEVVAVPDRDAAVSVLRTMVLPGDAVLVKASRLVGLETVAAALLAGDGDVS
jgi:UDP-N-acetylmuramoyl-tripeptide--D-alanyl-D-alanine ligase